MLIFLASAALADDLTLVAAGDATLARDRLAAALAVPPDQIKVVALTDVLPKQPLVAVGNGRIDACAAAPTTNAEVRVIVEAAERHVAYVETDQALTRLDEAAGKLACLSEPADNKLASRIHFLHGIAALAKGDTATADAAFRQAFAYVPDLKWDANFPPDAVPLFEAAAVASGTPAHLAVVPSPSVVFVDGQVKGARLDVSPGVHLVQFGEPLVTWRAFVDSGGSLSLVRPASVPKDVVSTWANDPAKRADLAVVLGAAFGPGVSIYVDDTASTWSLTTAGNSDWSAVAGVAAKKPDATAATTPNLATTVDTAAIIQTVATVVTDTRNDAVEVGKRQGKRSLGSGLLVGGTAVLGVGGVLAALNYGQATGAADDAAAAEASNSWDDWVAAAGEYDKHRTMYAAGIGIAALGAGAAAGGLVAFTVQAGPGYGGIGLRGRW